MEIMQLVYVIGAAVAAFLVYMFGQKRKEEKAINMAKVPADVKRWRPEVMAAAREFDVPAAIAMAVLWTESAGDPNARGSAGEIGLMQLKEIAVRDLQMQGYGTFDGWKKDPNQNIRAGVAFLALQHSRTDSWPAAVKAYNQGYQGAKNNPEKALSYFNTVKNKAEFFA